MKILLVSASFEDEWRSNKVNENSHYPLGIAYLHSYLEECGHTVNTLFLNDYTYDDCARLIDEKVRSFAPDIVGFNILTNNRTSSFAAIETIQRKTPEIRIIIGGIHATVMYDQILRKYPFLTVVIGEGEITAGELLEKFGGNLPIDGVAGLAYYREGTVIRTMERPLISDLDILPFPKHEVFFTEKRTGASILTSRGCPFRCSFCVLDAISRRRVRMRSVASVIAEIEHLIAIAPQLETVWVHDDQFFMDNQRVIELCNEIVARKIKLKFVCSARFKPISMELVEALERAGFIQVLFGLESGSPKILQSAHKGIKQADALKAISLFKNSKIVPICFLIVGLHGENQETVDETIRFVREMQKIKYIVYHDISVLTIYPGTEIYDIAKRACQIDDDYWLTNKPTPLFTVEHGEPRLLEYKNKILDHLAITRILTWRGFKAQYRMLPYVIKFGLKNMGLVLVLLRYLVQRFAPDFYFRAKRVFKPAK